MPRDQNGNYSLPPVYLAVTGQTVMAEQHNTPLRDIARALTGSLPRNGSAPMNANLSMAGFRITQLGAGQDPGDAATVGQARADGMPIGAVIDFAGAQAPTGWLLCYGQEISRGDYPDLFDVIGTTWGDGDGSTTFNVPDLRGRTTAGRDNMGGSAANRLTSAASGINGTTLGAVGGAETHQLTVDEMPSHQHTGTTNSAGQHRHDVNTGNFGQGVSTRLNRSASENPQVGSAPIEPAGAHTHSFTTNATGGGKAHNNVQPTAVVNKIIKARYV